MKQFFQNNGVLILVAAVLLAALLALGSFLLGNDPVAEALGLVTTPFRSLSASVAEKVEDWYDRAFQYDALGEANEELRARIAELEGLERDYQDAVRQNELYRELLGLAEKRSDFEFEQAEITQRSVSSWERTVTLNKGSKDGVEEDDCVVDEYGNLMGIVTEVDYNSCVMAAIIDAEVELGGRVARTDEDAILEGDFTLMLEGKLKLSYLTEDSQLISGDQITTSGLGQVYPAGLVVGTIESIHTEANGLDRYAVVRPAADLDGQRYVFIIKDFEVVE
jgi:rod shape-determining protein MreC